MLQGRSEGMVFTETLLSQLVCQPHNAFRGLGFTGLGVYGFRGFRGFRGLGV